MPRAQRTILYRRSNGHPLSLRDDNLIGSGGQGVIFALDELPDLAAKLYRRPDEAIGAKLALMVDSPPDIESRGGHVSISWPLDTLHSALPASRENTVGFLMHRIRSMQPVIQCYSPLARRQKFPHFTYKHLCAVAINTAIAVNAIHAQNYVIGDLNETNILVNDNGLVTLIDTDSFQVIDQRGGTVHRSPVGKPEYTPAELQGHRFDEVDRDQYHDRFGLGVVIYQLLMEGSHPFAGMYMGEGEPPAIEDNISRGNFLHSENSAISLVEGPGYMRWDTLDGAVRDLFRLCFDVGHDRRTVRPTPDMWEDAITQAAGSESLVTCRQNPQHLYFRHNRSCPWCGRRNMTRGKDPFPRHSKASMPALVMRQVPPQLPSAQRDKSHASSPTHRPLLTSTPEVPATPTAAPDVKLTLGAQTSLIGYWSDGTADVRLSVTLENEGDTPFHQSRRVRAVCVRDSEILRACANETVLSLPDGYGPASASFILRVPMGETEIELYYGGDGPLKVHIDVPGRILGVGRDVWDCYADRERVPGGDEFLYGRSGIGSRTVHRWLNDVPIKVWATGDPQYVSVLESVLAELAPILNLEFEWLEEEAAADIKAFMGVRRSEVMDLGFGVDTVDFGGFASSSTVSGETVSGYMVVWQLDNPPALSLDDAIRGTVIHEAFHVLVPMGHSTRPSSIMGGSRLTKWSPMDEQLLRLHYTPLVRPGMTLREVEALIVFDNELLDDTVKIEPPDALDMVWRSYAVLEEAGTIRYKAKGGWIDRHCNLLFGNRRGPVTITLGEFGVFRGEPIHLHFDEGNNQFFVLWSLKHREWQGWTHLPSGTWSMLRSGTVQEATNWWVSHQKLHETLRSLLMGGSPNDVTVETSEGGNIVLRATLDRSFVHMWRVWSEGQDTVDFVMDLDSETYALQGYQWTLKREAPAHPGGCLTYTEIVTDIELGVGIEMPVEVAEHNDIARGSPD